MGRSPRWIVTLVAFGLASVVNPGYFTGCASDDDDLASNRAKSAKFEFGEAELLDLVDEATGPFELMQANEQYRIELMLSQAVGDDHDDTLGLQPPAAFVSRAYACGNRSFMQKAAACISTTTVPLTALVSLYKRTPSGDEEVLHEQALEGSMMVLGSQLSNARITLNAADQAIPTRVTLSSDDGKSFKLMQFTTRTRDTTIF